MAGDAGIEDMATQQVEKVVRDYIDAWHTGDAARMQRALHDDLVKQTPGDGVGAAGDLRSVSKQRMAELTRDGGGGSPEAAASIVVHHVEDDIASAHVETDEYLDYLHLVRAQGTWRIVHDLFRHRG